MTVDFTAPSVKATREQLRRLEEATHITLSAELGDFLLENAGSIPEPNVFDVPPRNNAGVSKVIPLDSMAEVVKGLRPELGPWIIPFAYAEGGNHMCVAISGQDEGAVFFKDHEIFGEEGLTLLARSVAEFMASIRPDVPVPVRVDRNPDAGWAKPGFLESLRAKKK
jgi:hypothetical protein